MNLLIISKVSIPAKDRTLPCWEHLRQLGHQVVVEHPSSIVTHPVFAGGFDAMVSMGVTVMEETFEALRRFPKVPLFCLNWDCYAWIWRQGQEGKVQARHPSRLNEYDYVKYGELLRRAKLVWVPSRCTGLRTTQWWGIEHWKVVLSSCPWWDYELKCEECDGVGQVCFIYPHTPIPQSQATGSHEMCPDCQGSGKVSGVHDGGYALCCLRDIPDPMLGVFERCCEDLGIPWRNTKHEVTYEEYQRAVAGCRFLVSPLHELSTGGLSLMEGHRLGKPVLLNDSPWHGGRDYFGDRASYFKDGDEEDLKHKLASMMNPDVAETVPPDHKEFIESRYSDQVMVEAMLSDIKEYVE